MLCKIIPVVLLLMTGCVDLEVRTEFKSNGSGVQVWRFTSSALIAAQVKKFVDSHPLLKNGKRLWDEYRKGEYLLGLELPFSKVAELQDDSREISFEKKGWFKQTCTYTEIWKEKLSGSAGPLAEQTGNLLPVKVRWLVMMPGKIIESNADEMNGGQAVWTLTLTEFGSTRTFNARSTYWNTRLIVFVVAIGLTALAIVWVGVRKLTARKRSVCRSCGTAISPNAAFCSACGKSQQDDFQHEDTKAPGSQE